MENKTNNLIQKIQRELRVLDIESLYLALLRDRLEGNFELVTLDRKEINYRRRAA